MARVARGMMVIVGRVRSKNGTKPSDDNRDGCKCVRDPAQVGAMVWAERRRPGPPEQALGN